MDGIGNAKDHVRYLKTFFAVESVEITSMVDLGFGYGFLFKEMMKAFIPYRAVGIEPSEYAFKRAGRLKLKPVPSTRLELFNEDIVAWCKRKPKMVYDLGICTSVFQYISDRDLKFILPILARRFKYIYLTVPTDIELGRQVSELDFKDPYAISRTGKWYRREISKHFTFISSRILESKHHFDEESTSFTDLLFRF